MKELKLTSFSDTFSTKIEIKGDQTLKAFDHLKTLENNKDKPLPPYLQALFVRSSFQDYVLRVSFQFLRQESELNQIDKPELLLQYLQNHSQIWKNENPQRHTLIDVLISSLILERYFLDAKAGSSQLKINFIKHIEQFYSDD